MSSRSAYAQHAGQFDFVPNSVFFRNNFDLELKSSSCLCVFRKFGLPLFCLLGKDELSYQVSGLGIPTSSSQKAQRTDASQSMSREHTLQEKFGTSRYGDRFAYASNAILVATLSICCRTVPCFAFGANLYRRMMATPSCISH